MKLKDARDLYYFYSGKTSDLARQLGLAGIATIWLFKQEVEGMPKIPSPLIAPLILIIVGLAFDLIQYAVATCIWGVFQRSKEASGIIEDTDFLAPKYFNWPGISFFFLKTLAIVVAYVFLLSYLASTIT